jgi:uncharacterized protein YjbJ (UPF0337 family)
MTNVNSDEVAGNVRKAVGTVKENVGNAIGNDDLAAQGAAERTAGGFQAGVGKVTRKVNDAIDDTVKDLKKP